MKIICLLLVASFALDCLAQTGNSGQANEKRLALVIGNGDYTNGASLPKAINDANDMAVALPRAGFEVMLFTNVDKTFLKRAISEFSAKLKGYQVGMIYYAGSGIQAENQEYLVPIDADFSKTDAIKSMCLPLSQLVEEVAAAKVPVNIILIDADRTNPVESMYTRNSPRSLDTPLGFVVAYSTAPGKALVDNQGRNSLYTEALLQAMAIPDQTLIQMFQTVRAHVIKQSNNKQLPWESTSLTSDFYFRRK
ncbi:caspase family protein [Spirosoma endbachense]|uniref:Peptidase C14 caspase domain-containing protein n=1 Tax=Spirosoma endbachense TaxID=2666025 RepID=A0A6P1VTQ5_9BACT|nr:caspase family protein [Spirosoma endbachense]QHV96075.1 hypothetical protein GJR95_14135 [Spirosoma endbachense]